MLPATDQPLLDAIAHLCRATAALYDAVFYTTDTFDPHQRGDRFRDKVAGQQHHLDDLLRTGLTAAGLTPTTIPPRLSTAQRVQWISARLAPQGLGPALP